MTDPGTDLGRLAPYLGEFNEACLLEGQDVALIGAVCLRETAAGWGTGYAPKGSHLGRGDRAVRVWREERAAVTPWVRVLGPSEVEGKVRVLPADGGGWGFGLLQIDLAGPYGHLPRECPEASPFLQARWACAVLRDAAAELLAFASSPFYEVAVVCAYNAGSPSVSRALRSGQHPDLVTTGGDYGSDVLFRRNRLRVLNPVRFPLPGGVA